MSYVTAPPHPIPEWDIWTHDHKPHGLPTLVKGAWVLEEDAPHKWRLKFAGTHQKVPQLPCARTRGRALAVGRKALARLMIPANNPARGRTTAILPGRHVVVTGF